VACKSFFALYSKSFDARGLPDLDGFINARDEIDPPQQDAPGAPYSAAFHGGPRASSLGDTHAFISVRAKQFVSTAIPKFDDVLSSA